MNILQQPDALSLSLNLKDFLISSDAQISFVLKQGDVDVLSQRYDPSAEGTIAINLRDVVHERLSYVLKDSSTVYQQFSLVDNFTAVIDTTEITFRVIRAGVDRLADSATNFLTQNFLTWQPSVKPVTYYSPEFLTFYAVVTGTIKLRAYFTDDSGSVTSQIDYTIADVLPSIAYTIPLQYSVVAGWLGHKLPAYYDVWIENATGQRLTYIQRYYAEDMRSEQEQWILFENSLGGLDTFRAYGNTTFNGEHTHNLAEIDEISQEYRIDTERKFQKNTGHLNHDERKWLLDFFPSKGKYCYMGNYLRPIVVVESNVSYTDKELPSNYTFTFKFADARPLLNLPRTDVPADVLNITVPSVGSFTVPPRLAEFPRLPLSEGALFPIQNPYSEEWTTTTVDAIGNFLADFLSQAYGSGGGIGHKHRNFDLLQLLSYIEGYLLVNGQKIKAGYADKAGSVDGMDDIFLHKNKDDGTPHTLTIGKDLKFGEFISMIQGGMIDKFGDAELRRLVLRESLSVPEIRFNRMTYFEGYNVISPGGGFLIKKVVDNGDGTYTITPDREEGEPIGQFVDDILTGYWHNFSDGVGDVKGFGKVQFRVSSVDYEAKTAVLTPKPDTNAVPKSQMRLAQTGSFTNEERQTYIVIDTRDGNSCITFYDHANTWDPEPAQEMSWLGKKKGRTVHGIPADNYSAVLRNIIMSGKIFQVDDITGEAFRVPLKKGAWVAGEKNAYYDEVTHKGSSWLCVNPAGTTTEPGTNADWLEYVSKGNDGTSITNCGDWHTGLHVPYMGLVKMAGRVFLCKTPSGTDNPPMWVTTDKNGSRILQTQDGGKTYGYILTGDLNTAEYELLVQNGQTGEDGTDYEWIFKHTVDNVAPPTPGTSQVDDYVPVGWRDDAMGVSESLPYEWACRRTKKSKVWSAFSPSSLWAKWGFDGESVVIADFDNEMVNAALTSDGKTVSAQSWKTIVSFTYGSEKLPLDSMTCTPYSGLTCAVNKETGEVIVAVLAGVSLDSTNNVDITVKASKNGRQYTRNLTFTVAGVRGGADGAAAVLYSIVPSVSAVKKNKAGGYSVESVSCKRIKTIGGTVTETADGELKYSIDGDAEVSIGNGLAVLSANFASSLKFVFYVNGTVVDRETIPMLIDGEDGAPGISITNHSSWHTGLFVPYMGLVKMAGRVFLCKNPAGTENPPMWVVTDKDGNRILQTQDGGKTYGYIITGDLNTTEYELLVQNGQIGKDGTYHEWIFKHTTDNVAPPTPSTAQQDDYVPAGWRDDAMGVSESLPYEWACARTRKDGVWSAFTPSALWAKWGFDGQSVVMADFDNEMESIALTYEGKTTTTITLKTTVSIWYGIEKLQLKSIVYVLPNNVTASHDLNTGIITFAIASGVSMPDLSQVKITLAATHQGVDYSRELNFSIAGVRAGNPGTDAVLYRLVPSVTSVTKRKDGTYSVGSISCSRTKTVGQTTTVINDGVLKYSKDGGSEEFEIYNTTFIAPVAFTKYLQFIYYINGQVVDRETVPMVVDGTDGESIKGDQGTSIKAGGEWRTPASPIPALTIVTMGNGSWLSKVATSNPPMWVVTDKNGNRILQTQDGGKTYGYILTGEVNNTEWEKLTEDGMVVYLVSTVSNIRVSNAGSLVPSAFKVYAKRSVGSTTLSYSDGYLAARGYSNGIWSSIAGPARSSELTVNASAGYSTFSVRCYQSQGDASAWNDNFVAEQSVGVSYDGANGGDGRTGSEPRPRGLFVNGNSYVWNEQFHDFALAIFNDRPTVFRVRAYGTTVTVAPTSIDGDANWESATQHEFMATDFLLSRQIHTDMIVVSNVRAKNSAGDTTCYINGETGDVDIKGSLSRGVIVLESGSFFQITPKSNIYVVKNDKALNLVYLFMSLGVDYWGTEFSIINGGSGIAKVAYGLENPFFLFKGKMYTYVKLNKPGDNVELVYSPILSSLDPNTGGAAFIIRNKSDFKVNADGITLDSI